MVKNDTLAHCSEKRMNYKLISSTGEPVYTVAMTGAANASRLRSLYSIRTSTLSIALNNYLAVQVFNPANSTKNVYLDQITVFNGSLGTVGYIQADIYAGSASLSGTSLTPRNFYVGSSNASVCVNSCSYSSGGSNPLTGNILLTGILGIQPKMFTFNLAGSLIVPPNRYAAALISDLLTISLGTASIVVNISWWEE